jgi:tight adherence protein C
MNSFAQFYIDYMPDSVLPIVAGMLVSGLFIVVYFIVTNRKNHHTIKHRLNIAPHIQTKKTDQKNEFLSAKTIQTAEDFYVQNDPDSVVRLRMKLIQAGYMQPSAVGTFFASRFIATVSCVLITFFNQCPKN